MPNFSKESIARLMECHPDLQTLFNEVIKVLPQGNIQDITIRCGYRGEVAQNKAYNSGHSKLKYPKSNHNKKPSLAVDVYPIPSKKIRYFTELADIVQTKAIELYNAGIITHTIRWGGVWKNIFNGNVFSNLIRIFRGFSDKPHYEISEIKK